MKSQVLGLKVASAVFMIIALAHVVRLIAGWKVQLGSLVFGAVPSVVAAIVAAGLSLWFGSLACGARTDAAAPPAPPKA